jgi:hypothetical protein
MTFRIMKKVMNNYKNLVNSTLINQVNKNVIPLFFKKNSKAFFRWPFFLLSCYKVKICQKDTTENHLKIQALLKSQN